MRALDLMDTSTDNHHYSMKVVIEPRQAVRPGHLLQPALVVSLHEAGKRPSATQPSANWMREDEASPTRRGRLMNKDTIERDSVPPNIESLWAFIHLIPETTSDSEAMSTCDGPKLCGVLADTLEEIVNRGAGGALGYFKFGNLSISQAGTFRLRITLCRTVVHNDETRSAMAGATTIACVDTRRVVVHPLAACYPLGKSLCS